MKRIFCVIASIFLFTTCSKEPPPKDFALLPSVDGNVYATVFLKKFRERQQGDDELKQLLKNQQPLFEYTSTGQSDQYGLYYLIPLQNISNQIINGALIYPVDSQKSEQDKSYNGILDAPPSILDAEILNHQIPVTSRFLYSYHFFKWKEKGLKVQSDLTAFAEQLYGKELPIDCPEELIPRTKTTSKGWNYEISIHYEVVPKDGIDEDGDVLVTQLHYELANKAFEECMYIFSVYPLSPIHMEGPYTASWSVKIISIAYREEIPDILRVAHQYMSRVEAFTRFTFHYQILIVKFDNTGGGNSGSGTISGGGGSSGGGSGNTGETG